MGQPFTFPPPPPPPRKDPQTSVFIAPSNCVSSSRDGTRERGLNFPRGRDRGDASRGRGFFNRGRAYRGTSGGDYGPRSSTYNSNSFRQDFAHPHDLKQDDQNPQRGFLSPYHGQKRPYSAAFDKSAISLPRPQAAPAVPSFGGDILRPPTSQSLPAPKKKPRKHNQLGLTPMSQDHESSSDEGEEAKLANSRQTKSGLLQFEYKGRTATLRTAADIIAWIAERKKNFPTAAKAEAAKRDAEESRKKAEKSRKEGAEAQRLQRLGMEKARQEDLRKKALETLGLKKTRKDLDNQHLTRMKEDEDPVTKAAMKMERLKYKLEKAQKNARKAEEAMARMQQGSVPVKEAEPENAGSSGLPPKLAGAQNLATPPGETCEPKTGPEPSDEIAKLRAELLKDEEDNVSSNGSVSGIPSDLCVSDVDIDDSENDSDEDDATSSSGSSSSSISNSVSQSELDSDSPPEALTSKRNAPDRVPPPPRTDATSKSARTMDDIKPTRNPCRNILRTGRCQFGNRCQYSHDISEQGKDFRKGGGEGRVGDGDGGRDRFGKTHGKSRGNEKSGGKTGRKGLYQIMVEKEVEEERRAVMEVILSMGKRGMLGGADAQPVS